MSRFYFKFYLSTIVLCFFCLFGNVLAEDIQSEDKQKTKKTKKTKKVKSIKKHKKPKKLVKVYNANIEAGKEKAKMCISCHGINGVSNNDVWPNLAGQKKGYLIKQLNDFKSGTRRDAQMGYWAKKLSRQDIENIAAYYSSLK